MNQSVQLNSTIQFITGGLAGATGTVTTFPLEFLKTRLQSTTGQHFLAGRYCPVMTVYPRIMRGVALHSTRQFSSSVIGTNSIIRYLKYIYIAEGGLKAFYKGLRPALMGIVPTRAVYFLSYSKYKELFNKICYIPNGDQVHLLSAVSAGLTISTLTSPIWVVKTRVQLDTSQHRTGAVVHHIQRVWQKDGLRGFYRGLSASYAGSIETGIYFVFYERLKSYFASKRQYHSLTFTDYLLASSTAKLTAVCLCYPHEVTRTRLRQENSAGIRQYRGLVQTLLKVWSEEGLAGLYGGMSLHLLRSVPNTAITFLTYEAIISLVYTNRHLLCI